MMVMADDYQLQELRAFELRAERDKQVATRNAQLYALGAGVLCLGWLALELLTTGGSSQEARAVTGICLVLMAGGRAVANRSRKDAEQLLQQRIGLAIDRRELDRERERMQSGLHNVRVLQVESPKGMLTEEAGE